jgi:hypothetical protein
VQVSHALNPRRIARSLVTVFLLTLIQTVASPILAPKVATPQSQAVTGTFTASSSTSRSYITIPAGVESITLTITGGGGGQGGIDGDKAGGKGGMAQQVIASFAVTPGDVVALFPGNAGSNGAGGANINTGGTGVGGAVAGGASTVTDSYWNVNGTSFQNPSFSGGGGGKVGASGSSGSGGGGGAASVVAINRNIVAIAGGAGGGGGAGNATGAQGTDGVDANTPNSNLMYGGTGKDSGAGLTCSATDGGGGGGGGGGYLAGTGGNSELVGNECSGRGGFRGNAYVYAALSSTVSSFNTSATPTSPLNGSITYTYDVKSPSVCTPTSTIVDIYTVLKFDASINCTWTVPSTVSVIDIFAVGGGGGGGDDGGTGGGGGAGLSRSAVPVTPNSSITVRVGYGGRGGNFNAWSSEFGETSSVTTTASTFNAPGGQGGGNRTTGKGAGGSAAVNGTFAGGAGGLYPSSAAVGGAGNFGISNYFYGSLNTYAGGGGGGCYYETGSNVSGAIGRNGGGAGCSNTSTSGQIDGIAGTAGTGGGGGGGGAGAAGRVMGGKGGSGVIMIRYATNAADSFPSTVSSALSARFSPGDMQVLDSARKGWIDSSGGGASIANANFTGSPYISTRGSTDGSSQTDSSKTLLVAKGGTGDRITLRNLPTNYTLFTISRYVTNGTNGRLITANGGDWISGHYNGMNGCAHHTTWLTGSGCNTTNLYGWQLDTDQLKYFRHNGVDVTMNQDAGYGNQNYLYNQSTSTGFGINNDPYGQNSTWEVADLLVFNRQLTAGEIRAVENWLARVNGLTLHQNYQSSETDTAVVMDGGNYFYGQYLNGMYINDTFTVEGWVNPNAYCDGNTECPIFSYENVLVTRIYQGTFWYALYGNVSGWQWTDTKVKFQAGEWHHFALSKRLTGNQANAVDLYRDGKVAYINSGTPYLNNAGNVAATNSSSDVVNTNDTWFYIGARSGSARYYGQMDEIKIWKVSRTAEQIASDLNSTDATSANLQLYYDFNRDALSDAFDLQNLAWGGHSRSDMVSAGTQAFQDVKIVSTTTPYTTIKFPRNYLTQTGGWKVPQGISQVQVLLLGGGGGGGGGYEGGGGGAGGFIETLTTLNPGSTYSIQVGTGGRGAMNPYSAVNGETTNAFGLAAIGGGAGASEFNVSNANVQYAAGAGGSGGGGSWSVNFPGGNGVTGQGNTGGSSANFDEATCGAGNIVFVGGGGGGAGSVGQNASCTKGGNGGSGRSSTVLGTVVAGGGGGSLRPFTRSITSAVRGLAGSGGGGIAGWGDGSAIDSTNGPGNGSANTGSGGGAGYSSAGVLGVGGAGGSGIVALRYITAAKPTYTKPTMSYHNVGQTETYTTSVAQDSATAVLTRTFKWESTTPAANGSYTTLKVGTGAANAAYSWVPSDTSTTGSGYLYRLTVTDSDTAGLFITDSSTAYAIINPALKVTANATSSTLAKKINVSRSETFTITLGTPTYRATLAPVIPGITIDTSTAGAVILRIGDTATVGTWLETLTVTDSVAASIVIPLTINIAAPPTLLNTGEIVSNGMILNLEAGNSESLILGDATVATSQVWKDLSGNKINAETSGTFDNSRTCAAPTYYVENGGYLDFNGTNTCYRTPDLGMSINKSFTVEAWFKMKSSSWAANTSLITQNYPNANNINLILGGTNGATNIRIGIYNGGWYYSATGFTPQQNVWNHILGTYDGQTMKLYANGVQIDTTTTTAGLTGGINNNGYVIGKSWGGGAWFNGSMAAVRVYNRALTSAEALQNFNATKTRFDNSNKSLISPIQKYGANTIESFTATSGYETDTVTISVGDRTGIDWDATTVSNQINLTIQESLTVGTYLDTVTVTDSLGQSTYLPIKMTVTKADTLTVYIDTPTALSYTGSRASLTPVVKTLGAVGLESGTALSATVNFKPAGTTCATGGYCRVGDIGPGGGIVFIDTSTASSDGRIYEVAPQNWSGSDDLSTVATYCSNNTLNLGATQVGIGWGETNTNLAKTSCLGGAVGKVNSFNQGNSTGYSDWFIPSKNEAVELAKIPATAGLLNIGNNWSTGKWGYWASTEFSSSVMWSIGHTGASFNGTANVSKSEASQNMVRPVRAFKACWAIDTCTALATSETPTAAGIYVITPTTVSNSADLLTKYTAITYSSSRLTINRIAQRAQVIPFINTNYPETFTVNVSEGNGNGAISYSTANGTASGCAFDYKKLYTTSQGTCTVTVVKAGDRNYLPDTVTANVLFLAFVINQPSPAAGSGATIALSGATSITLDPNVAPLITSLSTYTATAGSTQLIINGAGFNQADIASITVKFWRNVVASGFTINAGNSQITVTVPAGATTGKVTVTTPNGMAVSELPLTITP